MRRRSKAKTPGTELRRLALAGRWDEVHDLLSERLHRDPNDAEARAEMERLQQGLPLRATESALARRRREEQEMQEELQAELQLFLSDPDIVTHWQPDLLARRHKRVALIRSTLGNRLPDDSRRQTASYLAALTERLSQHRSKQRRRVILFIVLPLLAGLILLTAGALNHRATRAQEALAAALLDRDIPRLEHALRTADTGAYRLLNKALPELISQARTWKKRTLCQQAELQKELQNLETGEKHISTLPLARRAELERSLHALPESMKELRERWQRLCEREKRALARQREEVLQRFRLPLPPLPELAGPPAQDDALLQQQQAELQQLGREWEAACELFHPDAALGAPLQTRLAELKQLREDIAALRRTVELLPTARNYSQYRSLLENCSPRLYAPALRMMSIRQHLPDEGKLRDQMQDHGRQLPPGMREAACHALLDGGGNFTPAFPANARQVQLMEDVFTTSTLQKLLYELSAPTLPSFIVEERPEVSAESVSFSPSPLTPGYTLDIPRRITWHNPQGVFIRRIDTTKLLQAAGITRELFFSKGNLPTMLETLLRFEQEDCPALARAYVFKRLLEVMSAHEWPTMLGIAYAPTLRADARSFAAFSRQLGISLEAGCWLHSSPETTRAEEACARWFHERRHRHYAQEIARNFGSLVRVQPRYVGFIDEAGKAVLYRKLPEGTLLWYTSEGGLTATPWGESLENPIMFSPVFTVVKD